MLKSKKALTIRANLKWLIVTGLNINAGRIDEHHFGAQHLALLLGPDDPDLRVRLQLFVAERVTEAADGLDALRVSAVLRHDVGIVAVAALHLKEAACGMTDALDILT